MGLYFVVNFSDNSQLFIFIQKSILFHFSCFFGQNFDSIRLKCSTELWSSSSLPWNQNTPVGYFFEICYDITTGETYLISGSGILLFISLCQFHHAFLKMLQHSLRQLDHPDKTRNDKQFLCELIRFHVSVKEWARKTKASLQIVLIRFILVYF